MHVLPDRWVFVLALLCALPCLAQNNLVANGTFETGGDSPDHWELFVMPPTYPDDPQAEGRLDSTAVSGARSALLRNPQPYKKEPYNNWSQQLTGPLAGKKLTVKGQIRTENATSASIWLQCWRKNPLGLVHVAETQAVTETKDWTPVEVTFTVPESTDFAILRCVLRGKGTAWFDDVEVLDESPQPAPKEVAEKPNVAEEMVKATERMSETVRELRESNDKLRGEIGRLQEEVRTLREQMNTPPPEPPAEAAPVPEPAPEPPAKVPVLVPRHAS